MVRLVRASGRSLLGFAGGALFGFVAPWVVIVGFALCMMALGWLLGASVDSDAGFHASSASSSSPSFLPFLRITALIGAAIGAVYEFRRSWQNSEPSPATVARRGGLTPSG